MLSRFFNKRQKQFLYTKAGGVCTICGIELTKGWHADHVVPWSKNGITEIYNGQALCPKCNLIKNDKMNTKTKIELREWQKNFYDWPYKEFNNNVKSYLLHAGVGSGKTIGAISAAMHFIDNGFNVIAVSPSENIKDNWKNKFFEQGIVIKHNWDFDYDYRRYDTFKGVSLTYHKLNKYNVEFAIKNGIVNNKTLLILDEVHHLGDNKTWGDAISQIGERCGFVLSLTGTPYRSDNNKIPFATYEEMVGEENRYKLKVDYSYSYKDSVRDKICCPISFRSIDVKNFKCDGMLLDNEDHKKIYNSAIMVKHNDFVYDMYKKADELLDQLRDIKPDAAGLVVCNTIEDARELHKKIPDAALVTSDESDSNDIEDFSKSNKRWIISVRMVSEGVDIPRLRVLVYACNYTTPLFFTQVSGRIVRNRNDNEMQTIDHGFFFYPNYEPLVKIAKEIENDIRHIVEDQERGTGGGGGTGPGYDWHNPIYEVDSGDISIINAGMEVNELEEFRSAMDIRQYQKLERIFAEMKNNYVVKENHTQIHPLDEVQKTRKSIHRIVSRIKIETGREWSDIHNELNVRAGLYSQYEKDNDLKKNKKKLEYAKNMLEKLIIIK